MLTSCIDTSVQVAVTQRHRAGGLNIPSVLPHSSGGSKSKIKMFRAFLPSAAALFGPQVVLVFFLSPQGLLLGVCSESSKDTSCVE